MWLFWLIAGITVGVVLTIGAGVMSVIMAILDDGFTRVWDKVSRSRLTKKGSGTK